MTMKYGTHVDKDSPHSTSYTGEPQPVFSPATLPSLGSTFGAGRRLAFFPATNTSLAASEPFHRIHYLVNGLASSFIRHENGQGKIISFPCYHERNFKIEKSMITLALYTVETPEFTKEQFRAMF